MSEEATLEDFGEGSESEEERPISAVLGASVVSSLDETSVGDIPDDWKVARLGDLAEETEYGLTESAEPFDPDKPRYIRTQDFDDFGGLEEDSRASLSWDKAEDTLLEKGDILFARSGSVGASLGKTYLYDPEDGDCCFGGYSIRHRIQDEGINNKFLSEYTLSERYWDWVRRRAKTTAQSNINTGEYASLLIPIPPVDEQRKIATVLNHVDKWTSKSERILEQRKRLKDGLRQDLFRYGVDKEGELRTSDGDGEPYRQTKYGDIPNEWNMTTLNELVPDDAPVVYGILKPGKHQEEDGVPVVKVKDIHDGEIKQSDLLHTTKEIHEDFKRAELKEGDLLFTIRGTVGRMAFVPENLEGGNITQDTARIRITGANPQYVRYFFETATPNNYFERNTVGQAVQGINLGELRDVPVHLPPEDEQERIVEILDQHSEALRNERENIARLKRLKKGLMQDLLSGNVRTTDTNIEVPEEIAQHG